MPVLLEKVTPNAVARGAFVGLEQFRKHHHPTMLIKAILVLCVGIAAGLPAAKSGNLNGKYSVTSGGNLHTGFNDDYASKGYEYFGVFAP